MNSILEHDIDLINQSDQIKWDSIDNHSFLITGSTGLIGTILVKALLKRKKNIEFVLPVRNIDKAKTIFGENENLHFIKTDIEDFDCNINVDYVIHAAAPTKSRYFIEFPIETLNTSIIGTKNILNYCFSQKIKSMVYLSSMEMYGVLDSKSVKETDLGYINPLDVRSSYSEGKRVSELYCYSYFKEKKVPVKIARLAMTFGAGISKSENRVYKSFCDSILKEENIVLKSDGSTVINFCYTTDAIIGILKVLIDGSAGEAYNIVGEPTYMSIKDSALWLSKKFGKNKVKVIYEDKDKNTEFAPSNSMVLNNSKLMNLGWEPQIDIKEAYEKLLEYMKEEFCNER